MGVHGHRARQRARIDQRQFTAADIVAFAQAFGLPVSYFFLPNESSCDLDQGGAGHVERQTQSLRSMADDLAELSADAAEVVTRSLPEVSEGDVATLLAGEAAK